MTFANIGFFMGETMAEHQIDTVTKRLARLERENHWWKMLGIVSVCSLGLVVLLGAAASKEREIPEEVRARRLIIVDENGTPRIELGKRKDREHSDFQGLYLFDRHGRPRATLELWPSDIRDVITLEFLRRNGLAGARLSLNEDRSFLQLIDHDGWSRVSLELKDDGSPSVEVWNPMSTKGPNVPRAILGSISLGPNELDKPILQEWTAPSLVFFNKNGKVIWKAP